MKRRALKNMRCKLRRTIKMKVRLVRAHANTGRSGKSIAVEGKV